MWQHILSAGPRPARTRSYRAFPPGFALLLGIAMAPAAASAQQAPVVPDAAVPVTEAAPVRPASVETGTAGPRRVEPAWHGGTVAPPAIDAPDGTAVTITARRASKGEFFLYLVGMVAVGAGTYKLGEALEVEALQSVGGFIAGIGLLGIILPIWLFY
jgi:hypothetical protein